MNETMATSKHVLPLRTSTDTEGEVQRVLGKLEAGGHINTILRLLANSPNGFRPFVLMSNALLNGATLPDRIREIAILYVSAILGVSYEWEGHRRKAPSIGIEERTVEAIRKNELLDADLTSEEKLAIRIAGQLLDRRDLSDADWAEMLSAWGVEGTLDLVFTVAWWGGFVPVTVAAVRPHDLVADGT